MPLPKTKNIGEIIDALKEEHPDMKRDQLIAIALSQSGKEKPKNAVEYAEIIHKAKKKD